MTLKEFTELNKIAPTTIPLAHFFYQAYRHHAMIYAMAMRDLQSRYVGTLGGMLWAFAHPLAIVTVFYFVFAIGFRAQGPSGVPFILWFVCGLVPWFLFNDTLIAITNSITANAHLVKKTIFPTEVLPLVHIASGLFPHMIFMFVLLGLLAFFNVSFLAERIVVVYFLFCTIMFLFGLGWLLSALQVFYRDTSQALSIILNIWFWATPIVWSRSMIPDTYHWVFQYNPIYYIIDGYRNSLIFDTVRWPTLVDTLYFWGVAIALVAVGGFVFHRLKPEFPDVI